MNKLKVVRVDSEGIYFEKDIKLSSYHLSDCCEHHELYFDDLTMKDFEGLEFDLSNDNFFERIIDYGIRLISLQGITIEIAGHSDNNGYYSNNLDLVISEGVIVKKTYDITECQSE